jgi:transcriptional regulator GlxA family with amidase domain
MIRHLVFDGVSDGSVGIGLEVVGAAARVVQAGRAATPAGRAAPRQRIVSVTGEAVRTAAGRPLAVDGAPGLRAMGTGDVLVLPGLGMVTPPAITAALKRPDIARGVELVARAAAAGVLVAASCSATFVLAASGILDGRSATTTWWLGPTFKQCFPRVKLHTSRMVVESGTTFTAGSAFAHADLMLAIVSRTMGPTVAHTVAQYLILDERASQARYMALGHLTSADPVLRKLEAFIVANLGRQISIDEMARATASSARTLARKVTRGLGMSLQRFVQRLRIMRAVHLLETTQHPIDDIVALVGYADPAAFRRVFRSETGETPRARRTRSMLRDADARTDE